MKKIYLFFSNGGDQFGTNIVPPPVLENTGTDDTPYVQIQQIQNQPALNDTPFTLTNPRAKNFIANLTGNNNPNNPLASGKGDIDNNDIFPSNTNAIAGSGSTPFWGSYGLYDTGVKFPFGIYYKNRKALQDVALAAMKAKQTELKPFDVPDTKASPVFQEAIADQALEGINGISNYAQQTGRSIGDIDKYADLSGYYNKVKNVHDAHSNISLATEKAATDMETALQNPSLTLPDKDYEVLQKYRSIKPGIDARDALYNPNSARYNKNSPDYDPHATPYIGPEGLLKMGNDMKAISSMTAIAKPYLEYQQDGSREQFSKMRDGNGNPLPDSQYAQFYANKTLGSYGVDPATGLPPIDSKGNPVVNMQLIKDRARQTALQMQKEHKQIIGDNGQHYTVDDVTDMLANMHANKLANAGVVVDIRPMADKTAAQTNPDINYLQNVASDLRQGKSYQVDKDNKIEPGTGGITVYHKGSDSRFIPYSDPQAIYNSVATVASESPKALTQSIGQNMTEYQNDANLRNSFNGLFTDKKTPTAQDINDLESYSPSRRAAATIGIAGPISVGDASIVGVKSSTSTPDAESKFHFDIATKDGTSQGGIIYPSKFIDAKIAGGWKSPKQAVALADGSMVLPGYSYVPVKGDDGAIKEYDIVDQKGDKISVSDQGAPASVPASYINDMLNTNHNKIKQALSQGASTSFTGDLNKNNTGVGHMPISAYNSQTNTFTDPTQRDLYYAAAGIMKSKHAVGKTFKDALEAAKNLDQPHRDAYKLNAGTLSDQQLYQMNR